MAEQTTFTEETPKGDLIKWKVIKKFNCTHIIKPGDECFICTNEKADDYSLITQHETQADAAERELDIGTKKYTRILALDAPGAGGACHEYKITSVAGDQNPPFARISFQKGPVKKAGINGCFQEDLIAICIDRLQGFQKGVFACRENAIAITKLEEALLWLRKRTMEREARGVEGTYKK